MSFAHRQVFSRTTELDHSFRDAFAWHERPGAFARLQPPWEKSEALSDDQSLVAGTRVKFRTRIGPIWSTWEAEHRDYVEGRQFRDVQISGPFAEFDHLHRFDGRGPGASALTDEVHYRLPFGALGHWLAGSYVRGRLERMFTYRHDLTRADLNLASRYGAVRPMTFLIAGASGVIGRALGPFLQTQGHRVIRLVRHGPAKNGELYWSPSKGELDLRSAGPIDVVINLAGENVAEGRWTAERKKAIAESRLSSTRTLVKAIEALRRRPFLFVSASASGFYGNRGDEPLDETAGKGEGFLAEVCAQWEKEAEAAKALGLRTAIMRTGVVLTPAGGALAKMLPAFLCGAGMRLGTGGQWFSWISVDDWLGAFYHCVLDRRCEGPINVVSPEPVSNRDFSAVLGKVLRRPVWGGVPAFLLKGALGQMAEEALLGSAKIVPSKLLAAGYTFRHENVESALRHLLGRQL